MQSVGAFGYTSPEQVQAVFDNSLGSMPSDVRLIIGAYVTRDTLMGVPSLSPGMIPPITALQDIHSVVDPRVHNLVVYQTKVEHKTLGEELVCLDKQLGLGCNTVGLNVAWPDCQVLADYRERSGRNLVLHLGHRAIACESNDPRLVAQRVADYGPAVSGIVLDHSGDVDPLLHYFIKFLSAIRVQSPQIELGIGYVMRGENLLRVEGLLEMFPWLNIHGHQKFSKHHPLESLDLALVDWFNVYVGQMIENSRYPTNPCVVSET